MMPHPYRLTSAPSLSDAAAPPSAASHACPLCTLRRSLASVRFATVVVAAALATCLFVSVAGAALAVHSIRLAEQTLALANAVMKEPGRAPEKKPATPVKPKAAAPPTPSPPTPPKPSMPVTYYPTGGRGLGPLAREVDRPLIDAALDQQLSHTARSRFTPPRAEGELLGADIDHVSPGTPLARLGFEDGDVIWSINGFYASTPDELLEAYARLRTAKDLDVWLTRKGTMRLQRYHVN
jgi:general secretion pathway protein C